MRWYIYGIILVFSWSGLSLYASLDERVCEEVYWGVRKSHNESLRILQDQADKGNGFAQAYLSTAYAHGFCGLKKNGEEATRYALQSMAFISAEADRGNKYALSRLATFFEFGRGVGINIEKAFQLHLQAAADTETVGNSLSKYSLGRMYESGRKTKNYHEALRWYEAAQNALGFYHAGYIYAYIQQIGIDYQKAYGYFTKAAEEGLPEAYSDLGVMHFFGRSVPVDYVRAYEFYQKAKGLHVNMYGGLLQIQSVSSEHFRQAERLEKGEEGHPDKDRSIKLYRIAAQLDNPKAQLALERLGVN
jgi:hypothetical protein